jgi:hypothetical protein
MLNEKNSFGNGQMNARLQRLHKIYGMSVRFDGDGTEGDNPDAVQKAIEESEKAEQAKFDKVRQQADQEKANATRSREQAQAAQAQADSAKTENVSLKEQLAEAESKLTRKDLSEKVKEIDVEGSSDPEMAQTVNDLREALAASNDAIKDLEKAKNQFEDNETKGKQSRAAENAKTAAYNKLLSNLDEDYGADNRNGALKRFQGMIAEGKVPKGDIAGATRAMEKCYRAEETSKTEKKKTVRSDSGSGGGDNVAFSGHKIKPGSLDDVCKQLKAASG